MIIELAVLYVQYYIDILYAGIPMHFYYFSLKQAIIRSGDMMQMFLPDTILWIMNQITTQKEEVFLVGGCVRDLLLHRELHDYDMTSSMPVDTMYQLFTNSGCKVIPTGIKHGTITVIYQHQAVEITTYRIEKAYENYRTPIEVQFTRSLKEDLKRRDFTINAMAYHPAIGLVDEYGGQVDLEHNIVRCVGDAKERFHEDALRILRALRFCCQLQFTLDQDTNIAIIQHAHLLQHISRERIRDEFSKLLLSNQQNLLMFLRTMQVLPIILPGIECIYDFEQHSSWHIYDVFKHTDVALNHSINKDLKTKLAIVLHDLGKTKAQVFKDGLAHYYGHANHSVLMARTILQSLMYPKQFIEDVLTLIQYHDTYTTTRAGMRKLLFKCNNDFQQVERLLCIQQCDDLAKNPEKVEQQKARILWNQQLLKEMKETNDVFFRKDLQVNGHDMLALGFQKKEIKEVLEYLCKLVIKNPQQNTKEKLMDLSINYKYSQNNCLLHDQKLDHKG